MTPETEARWRTSVHEAGHLIAAWRYYRNKDARAVLHGDDSGTAIVGGEDDLLAAIVSMAGPIAAAELSDSPPPSEPVRTTPEALQRSGRVQAMEVAIEAHTGEATPDDRQRAVAWATKHPAPSAWAERFHVVCDEARQFVMIHREEILEAARHLYLTGGCSVSDLQKGD